MDELSRMRSVCKHTGRCVVVHPVVGGHRAHCLKCGMIGPVRETADDARQAISARARHIAEFRR